MVHVVPLAERPNRVNRLGRHVEHDERSRAYPVPQGCLPFAGIRKLKSVEWTRRAPIFDQGSVGSCTGNAMAGLIGTDSAGRTGDATASELLALKLYSLGTELDSIPGAYPPDDTGSSGLAVMKAAKKLGYIVGYHHAFTWRHVLTALQTGPAITGIAWREGLDEPDQYGQAHYVGDEVGGHEFEIVGVNVEDQLVKCANSWSTSFGKDGFFYLSFVDFQTALAHGGDFTVPVWV